MQHLRVIAALLSLVVLSPGAGGAETPPQSKQESSSGITHSLLALGGETYILNADGSTAWTYPANTRDGFVLPNGNILLALTKSKDYPGGGAVEITRDGKTIWSFKGTQSEVNTVQ